jgi:hypothetical protein
MPAKKTKKKDTSWDDIGKAIGAKIEKASKEGKFDCKSFNFKKEEKCGGGFIGRLLLAIGVIWALSSLGILAGVSGWAIALMIAGFAFMRL